MGKTGCTPILSVKVSVKKIKGTANRNDNVDGMGGRRLNVHLMFFFSILHLFFCCCYCCCFLKESRSFRCRILIVFWRRSGFCDNASARVKHLVSMDTHENAGNWHTTSFLRTVATVTNSKTLFVVCNVVRCCPGFGDWGPKQGPREQLDAEKKVTKFSNSQ